MLARIILLWGSMFIAASIGLREFPPIFFTGIRFLFLLLCLSIFIRVPADKIKPLLAIGLMMGAGMYLTLYLSIALADNIASVAIFSKLEVPFAIILGVILLKERVGIRRFSGIVIAMAGAVIISFDPAAYDDIPALLWMAVTCALAAYGMIKVRTLGEIHPLTIAALVAAVSAPALLMASAMFEEAHVSVLHNATWVGLVSSGLYRDNELGCRQFWPVLFTATLSVSQIAPYSLLSPIFVVVGGVFLLDDELTAGLIIGGILILAGVGWIHFRVMSLSTSRQ